jgi:hypothetical protein
MAEAIHNNITTRFQSDAALADALGQADAVLFFG